MSEFTALIFCATMALAAVGWFVAFLLLWSGARRRSAPLPKHRMRELFLENYRQN